MFDDETDHFEKVPPIDFDFIFPYKHDWTVQFHNWRVGIAERDNGVLPMALGGRSEIYYGPAHLRTNFTAFELVTIAGATAVLLIAAISFVIARYGRRQGPAT